MLDCSTLEKRVEQAVKNPQKRGRPRKEVTTYRTSKYYYLKKPSAQRRGSHLTEDQRFRILKDYNDIGKPGGFSSVAALAKKHRVRREMPSIIAKKWKTRNGSFKRKGSIPPKRKLDARVVRRILRTQSLHKRTTDAALAELVKAEGIDVSRRAISELLHKEGIKRFKLKYKPLLRKKHREERLKYCQNYLHHHFNHHIEYDEKFFTHESSRASEKRRASDEPGYSTYQSKSHKPQTFIMVGACKPDIENGCDGKIFMQRVSREKIALRKSKHHERHEKYDVDCTMDAEKCAEMTCALLRKSRAAFPTALDLSSQGDNASPHAAAKITIDKEYSKLGITRVAQPAQSPDLNILDLVVFPAMQHAVDTKCIGSAKTPESVVDAVQKVWNELEPGTLHMAFEIKRIVMQTIILHKGGNNFKIPHIGARQELKPYIDAVNKFFESQVESDDEAPRSDSDDDEDRQQCTNQEAGTSKGIGAKQRSLIATSWQAKEVRGGSTGSKHTGRKGRKGKAPADSTDNSSDSDDDRFIMRAPTNACRVPAKRKK
ncbi:hypothetical protein CYMTET_30152 [Cymbomonas tetramitiformis]|uniref:Transposase Tc1-like domain-containing protein n=1 Tax=Cymbomonas tetramitiformis TaxID=36881 RepID=A0AAE0FJL5_9CHLO|nr:hypothetical protein CYMTET_30152 [Cymbomonas tetramitiformis]